MQIKLLRVLQEKMFERVGGNRPIELDVRIVSATNQDIMEKIRNDDFRIELHYRLNVIPIHIPPLRERVEDIPLLVNHFLAIFNKSLRKNIRHVTPQAMARLMDHYWTGNVRELENVLERAVVTTDGDTIDTIIFSQDIQNSAPQESPYTVDTDIPFKVARTMVEQRFEKAYIFEALKRYNGNVSKTAQNTGINPRTLWRKIKAYEFERNMFMQKEAV